MAYRIPTYTASRQSLPPNGVQKDKMAGILLIYFLRRRVVSRSCNVDTAFCPALGRKRLILSISPAKWAEIAGCMICLLLFPNVSMADAWVVQPSVRLEGIYDDSFRLQTETETPGPDDVTTARIAPALEVSRVTETTDIAGLLSMDGNLYFGEE
jgi:hypothetical protein